MATKRRTAQTDATADTPAYLSRWAKRLILAGKDEARAALNEYRRLAADKRVPKPERTAAAKRAEAIQKNL